MQGDQSGQTGELALGGDANGHQDIENQQEMQNHQTHSETLKGHESRRTLRVSLFIENIPWRMHWKGNEVHEISMVELGFKDDSVDPVNVKGNSKIQDKSCFHQSESSSESYSDQSLLPDVAGCNVDVERDVINALYDGCNALVNSWKIAGETEKALGAELNELVGPNRANSKPNTEDELGCNTPLGAVDPVNIGCTDSWSEGVGLCPKTRRIEAHVELDGLSSFNEMDTGNEENLLVGGGGKEALA
ncbi:hypothetical protein V6N12_020673 [Hibiscus sabdariffa]|uniref:Uncharacterized protein n=1 Tax=Hibiscus sabdariffa TaxID=183260 RepID=A0ABR2CYS2_9ROSI